MGSITPHELGVLFERHAPALRLYARAWLDEHLATDAVQEVFLRLAGRAQRQTRRLPVPRGAESLSATRSRGRR